MNKKYSFLLILVCLLAISCVTLKEPDNENQTLVVGIINMQGQTQANTTQTTAYKAGIEIWLQEFNGRKVYTLYSQSGGLFYSTKIPPGVYKLTKVVFTMTSGGIFTVTHTNPERIEIVNGKVNNFGTISGIDKGEYISYDWNRGYDQVRNLFWEKYNLSTWNQKEWINNGINIANSGGYTPPVAPVVQSSKSAQTSVPVSNAGWLGVSLVDADRDTLQALGLTGQRGAFASQVFLGSPAEKAGICPGDFITHVNTNEVSGTTQLTQMVGKIKPGERGVFTVMRDGVSQNFTVTIEARSDEVAAESNKLWPGLIVVSLTDEVRSSLNLDKDAQGLYVSQVIAESPAAVIGIQRGDRITAVNDTQVKDLQTFYKAIREKADRELWFSFIRGNARLNSFTFTIPTQAPVPVVQPVPVAPAQPPAPVAQQNVPAPQKYALVIGNGAYRNLSRLANPVNDANDMAAALQSMGFVVDKLIDATQEQMDSAVTRLKNRLSVSTNSYGFFFYAGHGVQSNGENFLIPIDANIPGENYLRSRAVSVQVMLNELNDAGNELNVIVLDACRDNPFGWARSGSRGLSVIPNQPADSIIVYATSAGSTALDGTGRNGLFTSQLLKNLTTPGLEVSEIFRRTGADVRAASNGQQLPAVYSQFFGTAILQNR